VLAVISLRFYMVETMDNVRCMVVYAAEYNIISVDSTIRDHLLVRIPTYHVGIKSESLIPITLNYQFFRHFYCY
jgi:hypothetical protein